MYKLYNSVYLAVTLSFGVDLGEVAVQERRHFVIKTTLVHYLNK